MFVILPLNLVGTVLGRNLSGQPSYPCRINAVPRPIPEKKWYALAVIQDFYASVLPVDGPEALCFWVVHVYMHSCLSVLAQVETFSDWLAIDFSCVIIA